MPKSQPPGEAGLNGGEAEPFANLLIPNLRTQVKQTDSYQYWPQGMQQAAQFVLQRLLNRCSQDQPPLPLLPEVSVGLCGEDSETGQIALGSTTDLNPALLSRTKCPTLELRVFQLLRKLFPHRHSSCR